MISLLLSLTLLLTMGVAMAEGGAVIGSAIQYDPSAPVNNGEDIAIEFWYWTGAAKPVSGSGGRIYGHSSQCEDHACGKTPMKTTGQSSLWPCRAQMVPPSSMYTTAIMKT